jgi:hypothetical protein
MATLDISNPLHPLSLLQPGDRVQVKDHIDGFGGDTGTVVRVGIEDWLMGGLTIQLDRRPAGQPTIFHSHEIRSEG